MIIEELKLQISELSVVHHNDSTDDLKAELIEEKVRDMIFKYCTANGIPVEEISENLKKLKPENDRVENELVLLDYLSVNYEEASEIIWHYISSFWPNCFENKQDFIDSAKQSLDA